jgi:chaperonin cofactor prefoldin
MNNKNADYRKNNDRSQNSSTYHKKDGTNVRAIEKAKTEIEQIEDDAEYLGLDMRLLTRQ